MSDDTRPRTAREVAIARAAYVRAGEMSHGYAAGTAPPWITEVWVGAAATEYPLPEVPREFVSPLTDLPYRVLDGVLEWRQNGKWMSYYHAHDTVAAMPHYRGIADLFEHPTMPAPEEP